MKEALNWLTTLPLNEHGFALHKSGFQDDLALCYSWPIGLLSVLKLSVGIYNFDSLSKQYCTIHVPSVTFKFRTVKNNGVMRLLAVIKIFHKIVIPVTKEQSIDDLMID